MTLCAAGSIAWCLQLPGASGSTLFAGLPRPAVAVVVPMSQVSDPDEEIMEEPAPAASEAPVASVEVETVEGSDNAASPKKAAKRKRPQIDLDAEIAEANRLAEISKKMLRSAKTCQANTRRQKTRLLRKAGRLSATDLERIAVLKRCGLYAPEEEQEHDIGTRLKLKKEEMQQMKEDATVRSHDKAVVAITNVKGAGEFMTALSAKVSAGAGAPAGSGPPSSSSMIPKGKRLGPAAFTRSASSSSLG